MRDFQIVNSFSYFFMISKFDELKRNKCSDLQQILHILKSHQFLDLLVHQLYSPLIKEKTQSIFVLNRNRCHKIWSYGIYNFHLSLREMIDFSKIYCHLHPQELVTNFCCKCNSLINQRSASLDYAPTAFAPTPDSTWKRAQPRSTRISGAPTKGHRIPLTHMWSSWIFTNNEL